MFIAPLHVLYARVSGAQDCTSYRRPTRRHQNLLLVCITSAHATSLSLFPPFRFSKKAHLKSSFFMMLWSSKVILWFCKVNSLSWRLTSVPTDFVVTLSIHSLYVSPGTGMR